MGSSQSKFDETHMREQLLERLKALELRGQNEHAQSRHSSIEQDYVLVDETKSDEGNDDPKLSQQVSLELAKKWESELLKDPKNQLAMSAFTTNSAKSIISPRAVKPASAATFNIAIPNEGAPVTNQRSSGRCWLFAATNVFRIPLMKIYNLDKFELSQAYLFHWDKFERANLAIEHLIDTCDEPIDGRLVNHLLQGPMGDGGQFDMVVNLVEKYGLLPQSLYPDSFNAMNSAEMNQILTTILRQHSYRLRELAAKGARSGKASKRSKDLRAEKEKILKKVHLVLTIMLGPPPSPNKDFTWEFYDKDHKYHKVVTSPLAFAKQISSPQVVRACSGVDVSKMYSLVNDPRNEYEKLLTVERLGNVFEGRPTTYVNVKVSTMKEAAIKMLSAGFPVFFGCDVGKFSDRQNGVMSLGLFDYELGFNVNLTMSKAERLQTNESQMTHAMVLTAVHVEDKQSKRWRVENSWSETAGDHGYFAMTDEWFTEFVYQVVVAPQFVSDAVNDVLDQTPKSLPIWDPLGALA